MAVVCECNVYTLCGMRPVDLRFFAYVYNVYNRRADVFSLCLYVVWLLLFARARTHSDDIFPTNMCTSRSICWPPFYLVENFIMEKHGLIELTQHCEYYRLVLSFRVLRLALLFSFFVQSVLERELLL